MSVQARVLLYVVRSFSTKCAHFVYTSERRAARIRVTALTCIILCSVLRVHGVRGSVETINTRVLFHYYTEIFVQGCLGSVGSLLHG